MHTLLFDNPAGHGNTLVISREKEHQRSILTPSDFQAICFAMKALDESFAFFNAGEKAGAR